MCSLRDRFLFRIIGFSTSFLDTVSFTTICFPFCFFGAGYQKYVGNGSYELNSEFSAASAEGSAAGKRLNFTLFRLAACGLYLEFLQHLSHRFLFWRFLDKKRRTSSAKNEREFAYLYVNLSIRSYLAVIWATYRKYSRIMRVLKQQFRTQKWESLQFL